MYTGCTKMNFLRQGLRMLSLDRHTDRQTIVIRVLIPRRKLMSLRGTRSKLHLYALVKVSHDNVERPLSPLHSSLFPSAMSTFFTVSPFFFLFFSPNALGAEAK